VEGGDSRRHPEQHGRRLTDAKTASARQQLPEAPSLTMHQHHGLDLVSAKAPRHRRGDDVDHMLTCGLTSSNPLIRLDLVVCRLALAKAQQTTARQVRSGDDQPRHRFGLRRVFTDHFPLAFVGEPSRRSKEANG
jgi:hypothetical protein